MSLLYGKPPITEAILDIRVEPRPGVSAVEIAEGFRDLAEQFPDRQELPANSVQIAFGPGVLPQTATGAVLGGFRYQSADQRRIVQARRDGFVFSLLPPYESWEAFCAEARPVWERYRAAWRPRAVVRLALRYVNQLNHTLHEAQNLQEYVGLLPQIPHRDLLPSLQLADYSLRMVLPQADIEAMAIVQQASVPPPPGTAGFSFVLDIDLFRDGLSLSADEDDALWNTLGQLRVRKNELFRACITDKAEQRMEPQP